MQQRCEPYPLVPPCCLVDPREVRRQSAPALSPDPGVLAQFSLRPTPSLRTPRFLRRPHRCRVGGGALARWPPSAAQTARAVFPHAAFTKTHDLRCKKKATAEWTFLTSVRLRP